MAYEHAVLAAPASIEPCSAGSDVDRNLPPIINPTLRSGPRRHDLREVQRDPGT
jgi:hypothetical protein